MVRTLLLGSAAALTALTLGVSGCSLSDAVDRTKVEETIQANLAPQIDGQVEKVDCPRGLKGEVGETMQCTMTVDGQEHTVDIAVTSVEGETINFSMRVMN